ncbi:hypothetical protein Celaphus_00010616 [Cervus elaphus hippelaphus]|uniref:Uncharacterized protein n=1 Tax=Cervus elaphus hippelaphus TaxID=46360 RepID=A0A212C954_CEREH|nr:hypothetical protein Celaphus_00010616 [Cervus elaphus hippelaphus]
MAGAEGGPGGRHAVFWRLREGRKNQSSAETEKPASSLPSSPPLPPRLLTRNLVLGLAESSFFVRLRGPSGASEKPSLSQYQRRLCINPPLFEIYQALLSLAQHHVALTGIKGLMILGLPKRWGKNSELEGGKSAVNCSTTPVAERFFTRSASPTLKHAAWYPRELLDPHMVPLTSDNVKRNLPFAHRLRSSDFQKQKGKVSYSTTEGPTPHLWERRQLHLTLGHCQQSRSTYLDKKAKKKYPGGVGKLVGRLPMHPAAEENYGYDACAGLCLPCVANILVITTESGMFPLCVVLEGADLIPSLYVSECVELELALKLASAEDEPFDSDFSCAIKLHRGPKCPSRYHYTHEAGVHSAGLPWIHKLHKFLGSDEEDRDSLQELATEQKCFVEHILCRKPLPCSQPAPFRGFWIMPDILGPTMICITSTYEYLVKPLLSTVHPASPPRLCTRVNVEVAESPLLILVETPGIPLKSILEAFCNIVLQIQHFLNHLKKIQLLLPKNVFSSSAEPLRCSENTTFLNRTWQRRRFSGGSNCYERKSLRELDEHLADKYEDAKEKQEDIMNRMKKVLHSFQSQLPVISDSERDMKKEL